MTRPGSNLLLSTLRLSSAALALLIPGCLFPPSDPPPPHDAGPSDAGPDTHAWRLHDRARGPYEPGTWLTFEVDGVDVDPRLVSLWVIDDDYDVPFYTARRAAPPPPEPTLPDDDGGTGEPPDAGGSGDADAGVAPRSYAFVAPLPIVRAGTFRVAIGTADGPLTREIEIDVVVPAPRMTQAAAADAMRDGIVGVHADVAALIGDDDPDWQSHLASSGTSDIAGGFAAMGADFATLGELAREQYMALPADVEPGLQTFAWNAGLLDAFAARGGGATFFPLGSGVLDSALLRSPVQGVLFSLDVLSMALSAFGMVCDVATILGAIVTLPAGGEGAAIGVIPKIAIAVARIVIDDFVPTDLTAIVEVQAPRLVFHEEGFMVTAWGRFEPQNRSAGAQIRSLEDLVITSFEAALPGSAPRRGVRAAIEMVGEFVRSRLGFWGAELIFQPVSPPLPLPSLLLPLDLGFYNVTLADVIAVNPALSPLATAMRAIYDPELISPVSVTTRTTGSTARADYAARDISIHDVRYAGAAVERVGGIAQVRGFAFVTEGGGIGGVQLLQFPFPQTIYGRTPVLSVQNVPDPADPSQSIADEDFIVLDVNVSGGGTTRVIREDTTELRVHTITIRDLFSSIEETHVDVIVNGTTQHASLNVSAVPAVPLMLVPGLNVVRLVSTAGHTGIRCSDGSEVCVEIELPDADNANRRARMRGAVGVARELRIWTAPRYRSAMED